MAGLDDAITIIKSLIAISREGLALSNVEREYCDMTGERLEFRKYGFNCLKAMLLSSKDINIQEKPTGPVCRVFDEKMSHVTDLVQKARKPKKRNPRPGKKPFFYKGRPGPSRNLYTSQRPSHRGFSSPQTVQRPSHYLSKGPAQVHGYGYRRPSQPMNRSSYNVIPTQDRQFENRSTSSQLQNVNENSFRKEATCPSSYTGRTQQPNNRNTSQYSAQTSQQKLSEKQVYHEVSRSIQKQSSYSHQKSSESNSKAQLVRSKSISEWSDSSGPISSTGWSTDSQSPCEYNKPLKNENASKPRTVEFKKSANEVGCSKEGIGDSSTSSLTVTISRTPHDHQSSGSDWSDSDEISSECKPQRRTVVSASVSMLKPSSNLPCTSKTPLQRSVSNSHSVYEEEQQCRPLMVGGIGRGKLRVYLDDMKPGENQSSSTVKQSVVVPSAPNKRVTTATVNRGLSSLLVKIQNASSVKKKQPSKKVEVAGPSYRGFQFIGDFYSVRVAQVCLDADVDLNGSCSRLCTSDLTIPKCEETIIEFGAPAKIVLMLGMTDILKGATFDEMKCSTISLLQRLKNHKTILVSLPVPPSLANANSLKKLSVLDKYNKWLLKLNLPYVIDIDAYLYCNAAFYKKFQGSAVETFSEEGSRIVLHALDSVLD